MITVTKRSTSCEPGRGCRQQCSSTPITRTPSRRCGSSTSSSLPAASTAVFAVCQATPRVAATRAIDRRSITTARNAHSTACADSFPRGGAAALVSWRHT